MTDKNLKTRSRIYLAHPVTLYGTPQQGAIVDRLVSWGFVVENPDQPHHQAAYAERGMAHFLDVVAGCDALAFMRFPDGGVGAGVAREILEAFLHGMPVYELWHVLPAPVRLDRMPAPILTIEETRKRIAETRAAS